MKYLILALCLAVTGCASHRADKENVPYRTAMQKVLDERMDIRQIISHVPRTEAELAGPAKSDPGALLFSVKDYAQRLQTIPLTGCPADFKTAFANYVAAWQERAVATPDLELMNAPGAAVPPGTSPTGGELTESTWRAVQDVVEKYAKKPEQPDF